MATPKRLRHRASLEAYGRAMWRHRLTTAVATVAAILGLAVQVVPSLRYPLWIWILGFALSAAVVQFLAYHETRVALLRADERAKPEGQLAFDLKTARAETLARFIREFDEIKDITPGLPTSGGNTYYLAWHPVRVRLLANRDICVAWLTRYYPEKALDFDGETPLSPDRELDRYLAARIGELEKIRADF
jgi:hypothetical protein